MDSRGATAFSFPAPNLDDEALARHRAGDVAFEASFVAPPATVNGGLGPRFNARSCAQCHLGDGRGPPSFGSGPLDSPMLVRVSLPGEDAQGGPLPVPAVGGQLQDHALFGEVPEARVELAWDEEPGTFPDGEPYSLRRPRLRVTHGDGSTFPQEMLTSARTAPPVFGLGLLEAVPEEDLLRLADPWDANGDGVSGRPNLVWDVVQQRRVVGRFGWKANTPSLVQQAAAAYANDMGVTSPLFPEPGGTWELDQATVAATAFYTQTLGVPRRDRVDDPVVQRGEETFRRVGCGACHVETLRTGADHPVAAVRDQTVHPYTDLLLHDLGEDLADGRPDFLASGTEWRTAPLWGLGLTHLVLPSAGLLHDGRARTFDEAILWHGGEAAASRDRYRLMPRDEREALLRFLESL